LHRRIHLTLQLQEIPDGQIFGFEQAEEDVVVFGRPCQVDVIVPGEPALRRHGLQLEIHAPLTARVERELL
jgi:hypothetical protein